MASKTNWKRVSPISLPHALELCLRHAQETLNRGVERVSALAGIGNHWTVYKWIESGRIPACFILPFEEACGINCVSQWIAANSGKLLVDIPTGRKVKPSDISDLQAITHDAIGALMGFYAGKTDEATTLAAIRAAMTSFAWHHNNVDQYDAPQLDFSGDDA